MVIWLVGTLLEVEWHWQHPLSSKWVGDWWKNQKTKGVGSACTARCKLVEVHRLFGVDGASWSSIPRHYVFTSAATAKRGRKLGKLALFVYQIASILSGSPFAAHRLHDWRSGRRLLAAETPRRSATFHWPSVHLCPVAACKSEHLFCGTQVAVTER